jgi:hypothetical protein
LKADFPASEQSVAVPPRTGILLKNCGLVKWWKLRKSGGTEILAEAASSCGPVAKGTEGTGQFF